VALCLGVRPGSPRAAHPLDGDAAEQELITNVRGGKLIRAREQAEKILKGRPDSVLARYGLAVVFHDEEGNLPRALYHVRLAEKQLAARWGAAPTDAEAQAWHKRILEEEEEILAEMDRREDQLKLMDRWDALYNPKMDRRRIWPLMKLHRFDEAVRLAKRVALSDDLQVRITGLNGLLAIESERLQPRACFKVATEAVEATGSQSCILAENAAEAAFAVYRFGEVERLAQKSLQAKLQDCPASAYPHLANLYLLRGDFQRAMTAVKSAREHGIQRRYRQQFEMGNQTWLARLLHALGQTEKALEVSEQVAKAPDRVGMTSFSLDVMRAIALVEHHAALEVRGEDLRERASARPLGERVKAWWRLRALEQSAWLVRRRADRLLAPKDTLLHLVRPYYKPIPPWNAGALVPVAGAGVLRRAIREVQGRETMPKETAPYLDALEVEILHREGERAKALELARRALAALPREEVLLRGRLEAIAAEAARRLGRASEAEELFHAVLERFATAVRLVGARLPVEVRSDGARLPAKVAAALLRSPRLAPGGGGFTVMVSAQGKDLAPHRGASAGRQQGEVRVCLQGRGGRRYACGVRDVSAAKSDDERVALAIDEFHAKVFAPKIDLTQRDINSLDGSAVRGDADEVLKQVLGK